jgi:hypothetical protein
METFFDFRHSLVLGICDFYSEFWSIEPLEVCKYAYITHKHPSKQY